MSLKPIALTSALFAPLVLIGPGAPAADEHHHDHDAEQRQHGAHVHGIAALNLAREGNEVRIELDSPAANIVGFEHAPSSADDHAVLDRAVATLHDGDRLFKFNDEAGCRMETATVTSELLDEEHDKDQGHAGDKAGAHGHEKEGGRDHEEHEGEHEGETHSDIEAAYHFECVAPDRLTALTVELFEAFSGMKKIKVQYVIENEQGAAELTANDHDVKF